MKVLLEACDLQAVIWNFADVDRSVVLPQEARFDAAAHAALVRGDMDLLLVHYVDGGYFHYDSVEFTDGSSWEVASETQQRVSEILQNCPTWSALQHGLCE